jgi:hypothetical protein
MLAYVTEEDVGLPTLGPPGVAAAMSQLPSELTFMNLALILRRLDRIRQDGPAHLALAREIYQDAPVMQALGRFAAVEGHVLFSEQGLFALMAQASSTADPTPTTSSRERNGTGSSACSWLPEGSCTTMPRFWVR